MAIALRRLGREGQGLGNSGVIRGEQDAPVRFPREHLVPRSDFQAVGHILRDGSPPPTAPGSARGGMGAPMSPGWPKRRPAATISTHAAIARIDPKQKTVTQLRAGSNAFTCSVIPDGTDAPYCGDKNGWAWFAAAFTG